MMKKIQGFVIVFMVCALIFSGMSFPTKAETAGDTPSSWAVDSIAALSFIPSLGVEKLENNYQQNITRGEFAYLSVKLYEYLTGQEILDGIKCFKDTAEEWVLKAKRAGLISGYSDQTFRPDDSIIREEIATMFVNVFTASDALYKDSPSDPFSDDDKISDWAKKAVYTAKANSIISGIGDSIFNPSGLVTHEQALVMLSNAVNYIKPSLMRFPKLDVDKIVLRDVESSVVPSTRPDLSTTMRVDKTDYPFEMDDFVIGTWNTIDFVSDPLLFDPEKKAAASLYMNSVTFRENGVFMYGSPGGSYLYWTKGLVIHKNDKTASRYFIATVGGKPYLFMEWKSGDYTYRNMEPSYYVFTKSE